MSTPYIRRPQLQGNTDVPVLSQPYLQGTARRDVNGEIPGFAALVTTTPADFVVETEASTSGPVTVTFGVGHSALLRDILATLNAALAGVAQAEERDGCVRLATLGVGDTVTGRAFIRVHPATTDWNGDGVPDGASGTLGFYEYPAPEATAFAGDIESAAARPLEQGNPNSTRFVARGEDRLSAAFNRGMAQLATNADIVRAAGYRTAAYPTKIVVDSSVLDWTGRLRYDAAGSVTQVDLSDLTVIDPELSGRIYVADLSRTSTLREIARQFLVTDTAGHELSAFDETANEIRVLRVAAVTRGENGFGAPSFADEVSAPTSPLPDTTGIPVDGGNALGVNRTKIAATPITEIRNGTNLVCASLLIGTGFVSQGVRAGDLLTISSSTISTPYSNDGTYLVDSVVSEQEVIVRPYADTDVRPLNESTSGSFGLLSVTSGGEWEDGLWLTFTPPLARFPEDGKLIITLGLERETLNQRRDVNASTDDASFSRYEPGLTGFEINQLWQRQGLTGAYAGMSTDRTSDAGSVLNTRTRPVTILAPEKSLPSPGTYVRGPFTGNLIAGGILKAEFASVPPHPDTFTLGDLGRVVKLSGGPFVALEPYLITEFIDGAHVRLAPLGVKAGDELSGVLGVEYEIYEDVVEYPNAILELIAPDQGKNETAKADVGILYLREQNNASGPPAMPTRKHGQSLVHLERVSVGYLAGTAVDIRSIVIPSIRIDAGTSVATVSLSVESFQNIFAIEGGDDRAVTPPYNGGSVFRIFNGPNAGYYLVKRTYSTNEIKLVTLDGEDVLLDTAVATTQIGAFYNAHVAVGHTLAGKYGDVAYRTAKLRVFFDSVEQGEASGVGISIDWRGQGTGISAQLNDDNFLAYESGVGAIGYFMDVKANAPTSGIFKASLFTDQNTPTRARRSGKGMSLWTLTNSVDFTIDSSDEGTWWAGTPAEDRPDITSWNTWLHQEGSDSGLIVTRGSGGGEADGPVGGQNLRTASRALVQIQDFDRLQSPAWGALDVVGGIYQFQPEEGQPGLHTDAGVAAGSWAIPGYRRSSATFNSEEHASLGLPAVVHSNNTTDGETERRPPDFTKFAVPHIGIYAFTYTFWGGSIEALNGLIIEDSDTEEQYKIVALYFDEGSGELWVAVDGRSTPRPAPFTAVTTLADDTISILGRRWDHAYVDVAEFLRIGTAVRQSGGSHIASAVQPITEISDIYPTVARQTPILGVRTPFTVGSLSNETYEWAWEADLWPHAQFLLHPNALLFGLAEEGTYGPWALGQGTLPLEESYDGEYRPYFSGFANQAIISNYSGAITGPEIAGIEYARTLNDVTYGGNLGNNDFCLRLVHHTYNYGISATWDAAFGGSLRLYVARNGAGEAPIIDTESHVTRLIQRGIPNASRMVGHYRAFVRLAYRNTESNTWVYDSEGPSGMSVNFALLGSEEEDFYSGFGQESGLYPAVDTTSDGPVFCWRRNFRLTGAETNQVGTFTNERSADPAADAMHLALQIAWGRTREEIEIYILDFGIEQLTPPTVLESPLQVTGQVVANNYLFNGTRRGFVSVSPAQISWLNSSEFYQMSIDPTHPISRNGNYFRNTTNYMGVGATRGVYNFSDGGTVVSSGLFRPRPDASALFTTGMYGATFRTVQPFYDPLWYAQSASNIPAYPSTAQGRWLACGPTGFLIPVDAPHGVRITGIDMIAEVSKSILAWMDTTTFPPTPADVDVPDKVCVSYQFYIPDQMGPDGENFANFSDGSSLQNMSNWGTGFKVRLWRHTVVGQNFCELGDPNIIDSAGQQIIAGFPEVIWSRTYALDSEIDQLGGGDVPGPELLDLSWDLFLEGPGAPNADNWNPEFQKLIVDRRTYAYYVTVEFYAGARTIWSNDPSDPTAALYCRYRAEFAHYFNPLPSFWGGAVQATFSPQNTQYSTGWYAYAGYDFHDVEIGQPISDLVDAYRTVKVATIPEASPVETSAAYVPGTFTIRGFRLTYETDKPRH